MLLHLGQLLHLGLQQRYAAYNSFVLAKNYSYKFWWTNWKFNFVSPFASSLSQTNFAIYK